MPVSVHTDDNHSPRTELLSPTSESSPEFRRPRSIQSQSQSQSSNGRNHRHHTNGNGKSQSWWKDRERELLRANLSQRDLVRMVINAERETTKLHSTLTNTITMLDEESRKCATLERDTVSTFTRLNTARESAQAAVENLSRDLRVAHFELEHARREVERLKDEVDVQKRLREEVETELVRVKDAAHRFRRERIMDRAREDGRREGFEAGFLRAQAESQMRKQIRAEVVAEATTTQRRRSPPSLAPAPAQHPPRNEAPHVPAEANPGDQAETEGSPYQELDSIPIITPPQDAHSLAQAQTVPMRTGYSPTNRPARRRSAVPERNVHTPSVDHYPVSIPPQEIIEQTQNISQPSQGGWVTGPQHRDIHGHTPDLPTGHFATSSEGHAGGPSSAGHPTYPPETPTSAGPHASGISPGGSRPRVKFRRPSLTKTKETAASWYRKLSFRKKSKRKILIDPSLEEDPGQTSGSVPVTPATEEAIPGPSAPAGPASGSRFSTHTQASGPPAFIVPPASRHSRTASASASSGTHARNYAYGTGRGHRPRAASLDSVSIHTSQFDMLTAPSAGGALSRNGPANSSVGSLGSMGVGPSVAKPQSVSGRSAKSQGAGIGKKLSVIRENPMSRNTTPVKATHQHNNQDSQPLQPPIRPFAPMDGDGRSVRSARSTGSRMVAVNPDPESPEWAMQAGAGMGLGGQEQHQSHQIYARPPSGSALLRPVSTELPVVAPLRTKKSGLSNTSGGAVETPTPMPKVNKGKGKERAQPMIGEMASMSGNETSPGIGIDVQTPSDRAGRSAGPQPQDTDFLSPRQSSRSIPQHSTPRHTPSMATSTTRVPDGSSPQNPPRSVSPMLRSTPKIFLAQGLPEPDYGNDEPKRPRITVLKHFDADGRFTSNAGMTPGPTIHQPLPSRARQHQQHDLTGGGVMTAMGELGAELAQAKLHRAGSSSSLRSQGSFGKFDASTYVDPAFWGAPPGAFDRPGSAASSKRLSYADP